MKFLIGNEKTFNDFMDGICDNDKLGILTHNDLDGIASAVFLEQAIKQSKGKLKKIF